MNKLKFWRGKEARSSDPIDISAGLLISQQAGIIFALSGKADVISAEIFRESKDKSWSIRYYADDSVMSVFDGDVLCFPHLEDFAFELAGTYHNAPVPPFIDEFFGEVSNYDH